MPIELHIDKKVFNPIYFKHQLNNDKRVQIYFGGSSSGKSFSLAQRAVLDVFKGDRNYLIVRNVQTTIKRSVFNEVTKAIYNFKLKKFFDINKSDLLITCRLNGMQILFCGLDDSEKVKSITPAKGVITDIWIEEATEIEYKSYKQLTKRLRGKSKAKKRLTLSFNPIFQTHWIYSEFFSVWMDDQQYVENGDLSILKTTYKDNKYLEKDDIDALENETDIYYYEVYTLGNWGVLGSVIYKNWEVKNFDPSSLPRHYYGIDWGFSQDPFAFIDVAIEKKEKTIYICDEIYATGLLDDESSSLVKGKVKTFVTADNAMPQSIAFYNRQGIQTVACTKGAGSIESGINWIKQFRIVIHPKCQNFKNEISKYKFKEDKNGNVLPIAVDKDNHLMDCLRYALESEMKQNFIKIKDRSLLGL